MKTINDYQGKPCYLSNDLYIIASDEHPSSNYKTGNVVRLIVRKEDFERYEHPIGHHFSDVYVTVHNIEVKDCANFCGIKKHQLIRLPECVNEV